MALAQYSDLKTAIQNWSTLTSTTYTDRVDEIILLCEQRIAYGDDAIGAEPLRVRAMESTSDLTITTQTTALPTGFLYSRGLYINTNNKVDLEYMVPDRFWSSRAGAQTTAGEPEIYTIEGENIIVAPSPDATYTAKLLAYLKLTGLSTGNTTNWVILNAPSIYLYGCLLEQAIFDNNDMEIKKQASLFTGAINAVNKQDKKARYSGSPLSVRVDSTP